VATGKIFCIGLHKTATVSLHRALEMLGIRSLHWGGPETRRAVSRALEEGKPLLTYLDPEIGAFSAIDDITDNFELADRQYPGSRFIFVRDLDPWVDGRRPNVEHAARVSAYFSDRADDLLVLDITGGDGWTPLCRFLGRPIPDAPFPGSNRTGSWRDEVTP
jgi:hypothetical protein